MRQPPFEPPSGLGFSRLPGLKGRREGNFQKGGGIQDLASVEITLCPPCPVPNVPLLGRSSYVPISGKHVIVKIGSFWVETERHGGCQYPSSQRWWPALGLRSWGASDYGMGNSAIPIKGTWTGLGRREVLERHLLLFLGPAQNRGPSRSQRGRLKARDEFLSKEHLHNATFVSWTADFSLLCFSSLVSTPGEASPELGAERVRANHMSAHIAWNMATFLLPVGKFFLPTQCLVHLATLASSQPLHLS